ncbi:MAG TPA: M1 family metallopeptidase [Solirubrobacteraceae bacterium]|nr:M1 family metallopeptidase [Solirubrobacteraceae bacterium]
MALHPRETDKLVALAIAVVAALALLAVAPMSARADIGADGLGDPYFPGLGNGGYDVDNYVLDFKYNDRTNRLAGVTSIAATALTGLERFNLDLKGMRVQSVRVDGRRAAFSRAGTELRITPPAPLAARQVFSVVVRYRGRPRTTLGNVVFGSPYGFLHTPDGAFIAAEPNAASTWFPCNDHPLDKATFLFRIRVPSGTRAVANGRLVGRQKDGRRSVYIWHEDSPMATYLATVDTGRWKFRRGRTKGGVPVFVAVDSGIARRKRRAARYFLRTSARAVDFESRFFGPYPFTSTGAIVDDARYHGQRLGFSLETQSRPVYSGIVDSATIAHELAHQWFGNSVSVSRWSDIWLNEGFASFAEYLWYAHLGFQSAHQSFKQDYRIPARDPFWKVVITDPKRATMFHSAVYARGAMTLQALREKIGDGPFFTLLRTWTTTHRHGNATTAQFEALAEQISGQELTPFFDTWIRSARKPRNW